MTRPKSTGEQIRRIADEIADVYPGESEALHRMADSWGRPREKRINGFTPRTHYYAGLWKEMRDAPDLRQKIDEIVERGPLRADYVLNESQLERLYTLEGHGKVLELLRQRGWR